MPKPIIGCPTHGPDQHYPPGPTEGALRQCRLCSACWQVPCACGAVAWQCRWAGEDVVPHWDCAACAVRCAVTPILEESHAD
jgi:hypothetical protein